MASLIGRAVGAVAVVAVVVVAVVVGLLGLTRLDDGFFALLQILSPHLALVGIVAMALTPLAGRRAAAVAGFALVVVLARFGSEWLSWPPAAVPPAATPITIASWNLEVGARAAADTVTFLRAVDADVVAFQELTPRAARAIETDPELAARWPYRRWQPRTDVFGQGLVSRLPIESATFRFDPAVQIARLTLGNESLVVVNTHPMRGQFAAETGTEGLGIDVGRRNEDLRIIRAIVDDAIAAGDAVVLTGDMNTASSEPAFDRLVDGLRDVHREVGLGPGWTWRPPRLEWLGVGLIRIDVIVGSPDTTPRSIAERCPPAGDHCLVRAELAIP